MAELIKMGLSRALRINAIVRKEIKSLMSDKIAIFIIFFIPLSLIGVLGASKPRADLAHVTVWIIDQDETTKSEEFIKTMKGNDSEAGDFNMMTVYGMGELAPVEPDFGEASSNKPVALALAEKTLPTEYLDAYIIIPKGFAAEMAANGTTSVHIFYDSIDFTNRFLADAMILLGMTNVQVENMIFERDVYTYPETRPNDIMDGFNILELASPIFVGLMLFFSMQLVTTQAIVGDIPLKRLLNTSLRRGELITGKITAYSIIAVFQVIISMLMLQYFDVTFKCLWIDLFLLLLLNSVSGICMGIFISTICQTRLQGSQMFLLFFFVMLILEYYVRNPFFLQFIPLEQTRIAFSNLAFRGASLGDVRIQLLYIALSGTFYYVITLIYIKFIKKEFV
jgi:ABC-2 family transporter protein